MWRALTANPACIRVDKLRHRHTRTVCKPQATAAQTHRRAHARVHTARACSRAHGAHGTRAWPSGAHTRTREPLLASARAPQQSHRNRTRTRLPAHTAGWSSGALNFPTITPRAEPGAAPGRGPARASLPAASSVFLVLLDLGGGGRERLPAPGPELTPRARHRHLAVRTTLGGADRLARPQVSWILEKRDRVSVRMSAED